MWERQVWLGNIPSHYTVGRLVYELMSRGMEQPRLVRIRKHSPTARLSFAFCTFDTEEQAAPALQCAFRGPDADECALIKLLVSIFVFHSHGM